MTTFQWIRREFNHSFAWADYPTWGFVDHAGIPNTWNVLRVIFRGITWGDNDTISVPSSWKPFSGIVIYDVMIMRGSNIETWLVHDPVPLQPTYVHNHDSTSPDGFYAYWASPPAHQDIEVRRKAGTQPQDYLDVQFTWNFNVGDVLGPGTNGLGPNVGVYGWFDVLCSHA